MALNETVNLSIVEAQRQISVLESQLDALSQPIAVPVTVTGSGGLDQVRRDLDQSENAALDLNRELSETDDQLRNVGREASRTGDDIEAAGRKGAASFGSLRTSLTALAGTFVAFAGAQQLGQFLSESIDAASDLEESTSKAQVVFGSFFDDIKAFADTAPQALGLANAQALEFAGTFGNLFTALGLTQEAASQLAPEIVQLGADLASFNNIEVTEALEKLRAGLVGEAEPLRTLGVNINAALVEAKALELGLADVTGGISEAAKVQARYALILEQTGTAQGDFARTADGLANTQRTLNAEWENAKSVVGGSLVPALQAVLPILSEVAQGVAVIGIQIGQIFGTISDESASLQIFAIQSGQAAGSAALLAGAILDLDEQVTRLGRDTNRGSEAAEDYADNVGLLVEAWGGSATEAQKLIDNLEVLRVQWGLSEEGANALREALERRIATDFATQEDAALIGNLARQITNVGDAAAQSGPLVSGFGTALSGIRTANIDDELDNLEQDFNRLPTILDSVNAALQTEGDEIQETLKGFLDDLQAELESRAEFDANLAVLRALGLDNLADAFEQAGVEEAALAASEAVDDIATAVEANDALERAADIQASKFVNTIIEQIEAQFAASTLNLIVNGEVQLGNIRLPGAGNLLENIDIPGTGSVSNRTDFRNGFNVQQNFYTEPRPTPETARAGQQVAAMVGAR